MRAVQLTVALVWMSGTALAHWHPHVMFFTPRGDLARWGANQQARR